MELCPPPPPQYNSYQTIQLVYGAAMKAYVLINIRTGEVRDVVRQMRRVEQVREVNMTFGPYDAVAVIESKDLNDLGNILAGAIQPIPGVEETLTCLAVEI
jgi:DNA-binding Lrp family transcriptional regulator